MAEIHLLEQATIDKIAAGEVVERPSSIVKELTENSIDAGAGAVTVEIRDGGISLIRITDNGEGIAPDQIRTAFLRHATSKITKVDDLTSIRSFGFRGEALSSIAAVSHVELITKTAENLTGIRYKVDGGTETLFEEIGAPDGSTFIVRDLFYNTPARRKFLKSAQTEAGYIDEFCGRLALSHPEISLKFIVNGTTRLSTSGSGRQKDVIYQAFGRDTAANLIEIQAPECGGMKLKGFIGKPVISRGNRAYEIFFVNGRLIKNSILSKAVEEGCETFLMQHRFPFVILSLELDGTKVDVNVHPSKAQVRFSEAQAVFNYVKETVKNSLTHRELIVDVGFESAKEESSGRREAASRAKEAVRHESVPEPFEILRREHLAQQQTAGGVDSSPYSRMYPGVHEQRHASEKRIRDSENFLNEVTQLSLFDSIPSAVPPSGAVSPAAMEIKEMPPADRPAREKQAEPGASVLKESPAPYREDNPDALLFQPESRGEHRLIGQLFDTYWIIEFHDSMYIVDQHAAHEKVMFERLMKKYREKKVASQRLLPQIIISLTMAEEALLKENMDIFSRIGFEIEPFGGNDYAICAVPQDLYGLTGRELFLEVLDTLSGEAKKQSVESITASVASMACKAAVKGNTHLSREEADALITELLTLENPYNCPHGRPTVISMTHREIERKFKRIV